MPSSSTDDAVYLALRSGTCYTAAMQQIHTALHEGPWFDDAVFDRIGRGAPRRTFPHSLADLWPREPCHRRRGTAADRPERRGREGASPGAHRLSDQIIDHNAFEEAVLFPLICARGGGELASLLTHEHVIIGPLARRVRGIAARILEDDIDADAGRSSKVPRPTSSPK